MTKYKLVQFLNKTYDDEEELCPQIIDRQGIKDIAEDRDLPVITDDADLIIQQIEKKCNRHNNYIVGFTEDDIEKEIIEYLEGRDNL